MLVVVKILKELVAEPRLTFEVQIFLIFVHDLALII